MAAKPDVLLLLNFGSQSSDALRQAVSFGMKENMKSSSPGPPDSSSSRRWAPTCAKASTSAPSTGTPSTPPFNRELAEQVRSKLKMNPNYSFAGSYICTQMLIDAIVKGR